MPILGYILIAYIMSAQQLTHLNVAVVDLANSQQSRSFIRAMDATPTVTVSHRLESVARAKAMVASGDVYAFVHINEYRSDLKADLFYNAQFSLIGKTIAATISQVWQSFSPTPQLAGLQLTALYNTGRNYGAFLLPALLLAIWQIAMVASGALFMFNDYKSSSVQHRSLLVRAATFAGHAAVIAYILFGLFGFWFRGSVIAYAFSIMLSIAACLSIGMLIAIIAKEPVRSLSFCAVLTAPAFAFMGVSFPVGAMPSFAQFWHHLIPINPMITITTKQMHYGSDVIGLWPQWLALACFALVGMIAWRQKH